MQKIEVRQQLTLNDFIRFRLDLFFRSIFLKILYGFLLLVGLVNVVGLILDPESETGSLVQTLAFFLLLLILPAMTILQARTSFRSNKLLKERITYIFTPENIQISGESFSSTLGWNGIDKVYESDKRILIY